MEDYSLGELGTRIKVARKARKKTQDEVAEAIGVGKTTLSQWERGLKQPGILNVLNYCLFLGMTLDELLDVQKHTSLTLNFTEEEFTTILAMFEECERESDPDNFQKRLNFLKQYIKTLFSRAQTK